MAKFFFEERYLNPILHEYFEKQGYNPLSEREFTFKIGGYPPPYQRVRIDFLGEKADHYLLVEIKQQSDPPNVVRAVSEALMYKEFIRQEKEKLQNRIDYGKPIKLGVCFPDFTNYYENNKNDFEYRGWNDRNTEFLRNYLKAFKEKIQVYLIEGVGEINSIKDFIDENTRSLLTIKNITNLVYP